MTGQKTPSMTKNLSESKFSESSASTATMSSMEDVSVTDNGFHVSKLLEQYRLCMQKVEKGEATEYECSYIARHTTERNPKSFQPDQWTKKHLEDAGCGRYSEK